MKTKKFTAKINTDNAAFEDPGELTRILREIADKVEAGHTEGNVYDINGNKVGTWKA